MSKTNSAAAAAAAAAAADAADDAAAAADAAAGLINIQDNLHPVPGNQNLFLFNGPRDELYQASPFNVSDAAIANLSFPPQIKPTISKKASAIRVASAMPPASAMPHASAMSASASAMPHALAMQQPAVREQVHPVQKAFDYATREDLRQICIENGLNPEGTKQVLSNEICAHLGRAGAELIRAIAFSPTRQQERRARASAKSASTKSKSKGGRSRKHKVKSHRRNSSRRAY